MCFPIFVIRKDPARILRSIPIKTWLKKNDSSIYIYMQTKERKKKKTKKRKIWEKQRSIALASLIQNSLCVVIVVSRVFRFPNHEINYELCTKFLVCICVFNISLLPLSDFAWNYRTIMTSNVCNAIKNYPHFHLVIKILARKRVLKVSPNDYRNVHEQRIA